MTRHLLDITDLTPDEVAAILALAERPPPSLGAPLAGQGAALIFEKPSNRTRHSMEMAVVQLGGHPVYTRGEEVGFDSREPVEDIAKIMVGYHTVLAARVFSHDVVDRLAAAVDEVAADVAVVNMLSDRSHPLQGLADALTMQQRLGTLAGKTVAYVGDWNNVARSLAEVSLMLGMAVRIACPDGYGPSDDEVERLAALSQPGSSAGGSAPIAAGTDPVAAVTGAHAVHTDTWVSMGQEEEKAERVATFEAYTVDEALMAHADPSAVFMHCLPAYRGYEVSAAVIDGPRSAVYQQGHNRLHSARAALAHLRGVRP